MDNAQLKEVYSTTLRGLEKIALQSDIPFVDVSDEELAAMPLPDVERRVRQLQSVLRTPRG
jgi:hypothetical protein